MSTLKELKFKKSEIDPCLLFRHNEYGIIILCVYVDDVLCIGTPEAINSAIVDIKKFYNIKHSDKVTEYVGCTFLSSGKTKDLFLCQQALIDRMEKEFFNDIKSIRIPTAPLSPGDVVIRSKDESELIHQEQQKKFRSGVGMLLYLVKYSRPDIANAVRELSKVMDGATPAHLKSLHRLIKFVTTTRDKCVIMKNDDLQDLDLFVITAFCDSDYAGDKDTRLSVTGFVIYIANTPISWRSRGQKSVTLSSSEAEYVALSEVCAEILFVKQLCEFLNMKVKLPIQVMVDNVGAIFLSQNQSVNQRTRHIDVRYHFLREHVENGTIEVNFVRSEDNIADLFTKNVGIEVYKKHSGKLLGTMPVLNNRKGVEDTI